MVLVLVSLLATLAASSVAECSSATCPRLRSGRGISLLQASRNKSALAPSASDSSNASSLDDAVAVAEGLGNAAEQVVSGSSGSGSTSNEDTTVVVQNLSQPQATANYSQVIDTAKEVVHRAPYTQQHNETSPIIKPIKGAAALPEPKADNITGAMRDCVLGDWGEWSECVSDGASGSAGPHQIRRRSVIQPWLPGGLRCDATEQSQGCNLISAASTIVSLNIG
ncbi:unnamed protein product [Symbiodinium natans]|uniref:Uncharacterized protein n=1 Tax=Symbiodinium natans TaxID=878477 RepID=A0A812UNQ7_9DINO|nr:unnamed protein product [Symbiodinium natans]